MVIKSWEVNNKRMNNGLSGCETSRGECRGAAEGLDPLVSRTKTWSMSARYTCYIAIFWEPLTEVRQRSQLSPATEILWKAGTANDLFTPRGPRHHGSRMFLAAPWSQGVASRVWIGVNETNQTMQNWYRPVTYKVTTFEGITEKCKCNLCCLWTCVNPTITMRAKWNHNHVLPCW